MEKIQFMPEDGNDPVDFYVLEETKLAGRHYLLVTDDEEGDGEALILRAEHSAGTRPSGPRKTEKKPGGGPSGKRKNDAPEDVETEEAGEDAVVYEIVEDERELSAVLLLLRDSLEELGIIVE